MSETQDSKQTEVGNYFISNYPPFGFWKTEDTQLLDTVLESEANPETPLGLYVHIPFCRKRCHFCYFRVYTDKNSDEIKTYLDTAIRELEKYSKAPYFKNRKPSFIYFGGGTPSYLSREQLFEFTDRLKALMPWDEAIEVAFEAEPGTLTEQKLAALKEIGVTRLSLGYENFDDRVLEINGRAHRSKEIGRSWEYVRSLGFDQVNIDLIAGMLEETEDNWWACIDKAIELAPECVTIYQMEVPYNTTIYKRMKAEGTLKAPVADWNTKRRWVDGAFNRLTEAGYTVTSATTAVRDSNKIKFVYRDRLWDGADLLSLGVASFSHLKGTHFQNEHNLAPYLEKVQAGEAPIYRALQLTDQEKLIREFVLKLKLGYLDTSILSEKYDTDVLKTFEKPLNSLTERGLLNINGSTIQLTRQGLLQVDAFLPEFFLPEHQGGRYA